MKTLAIFFNSFFNPKNSFKYKNKKIDKIKNKAQSVTAKISR